MNTKTVDCTTLFARVTALLASPKAQLSRSLEQALSEVVTALGADRGFIAMADYEHGELAVKETAGTGWNEINRRLRLKVSQETGRGITSRVAATGQVYRTGDVSTDPYYMRYFADAKSELAVPIFDSTERCQAVINLESVEPDAFTEEHEELVEAVGQLIALRLQVADQKKRQAALVTLGREIGRISRSRDLQDKVIKLVASAISFEACSVFLMDKDEEYVVLEASSGDLDGLVREARYKVGEGLTGWVAQHGEPIRISDPRKDSRWKGRHEELPPEEVGGIIVAPIFGYDRLLGVFRLLRRRSKFAWVPNHFTEEDEGLVLAICSILGAVIDSLALVRRVVDAERMAAWGELSARSAHMIGNRVFAIKGDLNELRHLMEEGNCEQGVADIVPSLEKGIFRLEEILAEFREFVVATRLDSAEVDINEIVREAVSESFPKKSAVKLVLDLAEGLPKVEADAAKLRRCFSELVENSFNFQQEGEITVSTGLAENDNQHVRIVFADGGPGIPAEMKKNIFRPFFTTRSKGMGLGLSIVKGIVDAHRGTIREFGEEGQGAKFEILLPALVDDSPGEDSEEQE